MKQLDQITNVSSLHINKITFFPPPPGPAMEAGKGGMPPHVYEIQAEVWVGGKDLTLGPISMMIHRTHSEELCDVAQEFADKIEEYVHQKLTKTEIAATPIPENSLLGIGDGDF